VRIAVRELEQFAATRVRLGSNHLVTAHRAKADDGSETLRIAFSSHEAQIEGHNLRDLVLGIQDFAIEWFRAIPEQYQSLAPSREEVVRSVRITAIE
jgi:hypothetical protein